MSLTRDTRTHHAGVYMYTNTKYGMYIASFPGWPGKEARDALYVNKKMTTSKLENTQAL